MAGFRKFTDKMSRQQPSIDGLESKEDRDSRLTVARIAGGSAPPTAGEFVRLPVSQIDADPDQIRQHFDEGKLDELAESLHRNGQEQPIIVRKHPQLSGRYMLIDGERRWRAAQRGDIKTLEAIVREKNANDAIKTQIISNLDREGNTPYEVARALRRYKEMREEELGRKMNQDQLASELGWHRNRVGSFQKIDKLRVAEVVAYVTERNIMDPQRVRALAALFEEDPATFADLTSQETTPTRVELHRLAGQSKEERAGGPGANRPTKKAGAAKASGTKDTGPPKTVTAAYLVEEKGEHTLYVHTKSTRYRFSLTPAQLAAIKDEEPRAKDEASPA